MTLPHAEYRRRFERVLDQMGRTHDIEDIMQALQRGSMQSFTQGESWAITQIVTFPKKRVLEVFLVVGERERLQGLHDDVMAFAKAEGCDLVRAFGRNGWLPDAEKNGWQAGLQIYLKEVA